MNIDFTSDEGYRFILVSDNSESAVNWVFLPGGPGLGSEYFTPFLNGLVLPGKIWRLDFPGDGSNLQLVDFNDWEKGLVPAINQLNNVILVTHSFSGMFVLTIPELENCLMGLVIMDAAPNQMWQAALNDSRDTIEQKMIYERNKSDENLKNFTIASWRYFMSSKFEYEAKQLLAALPYNYKAFEWAGKYFHPYYTAKWVPQQLPTLILAGSDDALTPLKLFKNDGRFERDNITIKEIPNASHFPWMEEPQLVSDELRGLLIII